MVDHAPVSGTPLGAEEPISDYDRIGGGRAVSAVVDRFYESVLADPQLAPFFVETDVNRLKRHQVLLISQVMGGPADYDGRSLRDPHDGLNISSNDFGRVVTHLVTALQEASVPGDVIGRLGTQLGAAEKDVVQAVAD
ncbi:MAG TPA: group 1 truncated hemoglobin [Jatrophihabitantaceae bacterium]|jgi:hemoglobin